MTTQTVPGADEEVEQFEVLTPPLSEEWDPQPEDMDDDEPEPAVAPDDSDEPLASDDMKSEADAIRAEVMRDLESGKISFNEAAIRFTIAPLGPLSRERIVKYADTTFRIDKMAPEDQLEVFEMLRVAIGDQLALNNGRMISLLSLPADTVAAIRETLFRNIKFKNERAPRPVTLQGNFGRAFKEVEVWYVQELMLRSLAVNFFVSSTAAVGFLLTILPRFNPFTVLPSTPSSQDQ